MDRNDGIKIVFFRIIVVFPEIIDQDGIVFRVYDPVFLHACILIFI